MLNSFYHISLIYKSPNSEITSLNPHRSIKNPDKTDNLQQFELIQHWNLRITFTTIVEILLQSCRNFSLGDCDKQTAQCYVSNGDWLPDKEGLVLYKETELVDKLSCRSCQLKGKMWVFRSDLNHGRCVWRLMSWNWNLTIKIERLIGRKHSGSLIILHSVQDLSTSML